MSLFKLVRYAEADLAALAEHSKTVGWYETPDWECFLKTGMVIGHRDEAGGIATTAYLSNYGQRLGWLGAFIVNPKYQGMGLGTALMKKCHNLFSHPAFVMGLVSTEEGLPLYRKMGFEQIGHTQKLVAPPGFSFPSHAVPDGLTIRAYVDTDFDAVVALDSQTVGVKRAALLRARLPQSRNAFVAEGKEGVEGFAMGVSDSGRLILGPVHAPDLPAALALMSHVGECSEGELRADVWDWQVALGKALLADGFKLERQCPVMTFQGRPLPKSMLTHYSMMSQALG